MPRSPNEQTPLLPTHTTSNSPERITYTSYPTPKFSTDSKIRDIFQGLITAFLLVVPYICIPSSIIATPLCLFLKPAATHINSSAERSLLCALPALAVFWLVVHLYEPRVDRPLQRGCWVTDRMRHNLRNFVAFLSAGGCVFVVGRILDGARL